MGDVSYAEHVCFWFATGWVLVILVIIAANLRRIAVALEAKR